MDCIKISKTSAARLLCAIATIAVLSALAPSFARADEAARITVLEENDSLYVNSDKHYTQGLRLSDLSPAVTEPSWWNGPFNLLGNHTPLLAPDEATQRRYSLFLGQSLFTPKNLSQKPPPTSDRPYGGWLYVGTSLLQEDGAAPADPHQLDHHSLENFEIDLGVVGPMALGEETQNDFHQLIGANLARGWSNQIQNEPGVVVSYERLWHVPLIGDNSFGVDAVPQVGASVGNVFTYAEAGGILRIGKSLSADYGQAHIRPSLSGTDFFDSDRLDNDTGYYFFVGAQGRAVGRDIFLDGNTFRQSPSVKKQNLVADLMVGASYDWSPALRVDFSLVRRTEEFVGQRTPDEIGSAALTFAW